MALKSAGHQVGILSVGFITPRYLLAKYPYLQYEEVEGVNIYRSYERMILPFRFRAPKTILEKNIALVESLYRSYALKHGRPDVIHAHNFLYAGAIARYFRDEYSIPFVLTEHSSAFAREIVSQKAQKIVNHTCSGTNQLTCVSGEFKKLLESKYNAKFQVLHNILSRAFYSSGLCTAQDGQFNFISVAVADENKAQGVLLEAFSLAFKGGEEILRIVGDGPLLEQLKEEANRLGISNQVVFTGRLSREGVCESMLKSNCFVLPSRYETFGVVLIEAMASGLPLIATKCGGPEDIVNDGNGVLVDVDDVRGLSSAMLLVKKNIKSYSPHRLRQEAIDRFGEDAFVRKVVPIYEAAIND